LGRIWKYNQRYHRKLLLVDGEIGFTGGMNIRDRHMVESLGGNPMRDTVFELEGPVLEVLDALFLSDWVYCGPKGDHGFTAKSEYIRSNGLESVVVLGAGPPFRRGSLQDALAVAIEHSTTRVVVVTPFFFPGHRLLDVLAGAALRGVAIDLILPTGDYEFLTWCAGDFLAHLIRCGCSAYFSPPPYDHSKILLIDQAVWIGTVNLDYRSLYLNWEVAMECRGGSLVVEVENLVDEQLAASSRVSLDDLRERFPRDFARKLLMNTLGKLF
jgi:cardiolipin synthase